MVHIQTNQVQTKRRKRAYLLVVSTFVCWASYVAINQSYDMDVLQYKYEATQAEQQKIETKKADLENQVLLLQDPEYISQLATKEQGMVYEGQQQIFTDTP